MTTVVRMNWTVWAKPHPAENAPGWEILSTHRWRWVAKFHAWLYEATGFDHITRVEAQPEGNRT